MSAALTRPRRENHEEDEQNLLWRWIVDLQFMVAGGLALVATLFAAGGHGWLVVAGIVLGALVVWWAVTHRHNLARRLRARSFDSLATIRDPVVHDRVISLMLIGIGVLLVLIVLLARLGVGS